MPIYKFLGGPNDGMLRPVSGDSLAIPTTITGGGMTHISVASYRKDGQATMRFGGIRWSFTLAEESSQ